MSKFNHIAISVLLLSLAGGSAFVVGKSFLAGEGSEPVEPPIPPSGPRQQPPTPGPGFTGELNGFYFFDDSIPSPPTPELSPKCRWTETGNNIRYASEQEGAASDLHFTATCFPVGTDQGGVSVSACEDDIVTIGRDYRVAPGISPQGGLVSIYRERGPAVRVRTPFFGGPITRDQLRPASLNNRPAVIVSPQTPKGRMVVFLRDKTSHWEISCFQVDEAECIKVAEGVR